MKGEFLLVALLVTLLIALLVTLQIALLHVREGSESSHGRLSTTESGWLEPVEERALQPANLKN